MVVVTSCPGELLYRQYKLPKMIPAVVLLCMVAGTIAIPVSTDYYPKSQGYGRRTHGGVIRINNNGFEAGILGFDGGNSVAAASAAASGLNSAAAAAAAAASGRQGLIGLNTASQRSSIIGFPGNGLIAPQRHIIPYTVVPQIGGLGGSAAAAAAAASQQSAAAAAAAAVGRNAAAAAAAAAGRNAAAASAAASGRNAAAAAAGRNAAAAAAAAASGAGMGSQFGFGGMTGSQFNGQIGGHSGYFPGVPVSGQNSGAAAAGSAAASNNAAAAAAAAAASGSNGFINGGIIGGSSGIIGSRVVPGRKRY
ncbi:uncharacterized protein LOC111130716 [Crassostrea virginica]